MFEEIFPSEVKVGDVIETRREDGISRLEKVFSIEKKVAIYQESYWTFVKETNINCFCFHHNEERTISSYFHGGFMPVGTHTQKGQWVKGQMVRVVRNER